MSTLYITVDAYDGSLETFISQGMVDSHLQYKKKGKTEHLWRNRGEDNAQVVYIRLVTRLYFMF